MNNRENNTGRPYPDDMPRSSMPTQGTPYRENYPPKGAPYAGNAQGRSVTNGRGTAQGARRQSPPPRQGAPRPNQVRNGAPRRPSGNKRRRKRRSSGTPIIASVVLILMIAAVITAVAISSRKAPAGTDTSASGTATQTPTAPVTSTPTDSPTTGAPVTSDPPTTSAPTASDTSVVTPPVTDVILGETADAGEDYLDKIVFLGDSTTYHLMVYGPWNDGNHNGQVWTGEAYTLTLQYVNLETTKLLLHDTGEKLTIPEAAASRKPEIMVITLGINGVLYMPEAYFKGVYTEMINNIKAASPDTKIILNSMFPVMEKCSNGTLGNNAQGQPFPHIPKVNVDAGNEWILELARETGCYYLNSQEAIADENGFLPENISLMDGVHLNGVAYEKFLNYVRTHAIPEYVN